MNHSLVSLELISDTLTIWDHNLATKIYQLGFFGKPLGVRKAIPGEDLDRPLTLSLFDGLYLLENGIITIEHEGEMLDTEKFTKYADNIFEDFSKKYDVYREFRKKGYVVKPGMKFGTDFIVYEKGPGLDHSKWAVLVEDDNSKLRAINIVRAGRLAHSVKKTFLIATKREDKHRYFSFTRFKL